MSVATPSTPAAKTSRWPLERVLFALAGTMVIASVLLAVLVSEWFLLLTAFVGLNQLMYVAVGTCGAAFVLQRVFGLEKGCAR